jgi:hypothetical protein
VPALPSSLISPAVLQLASAPVGPLPPGDCAGLQEFLATAPDPRDPRGIRHSLASVLLTSLAAVLAGARSLAAIGEWAADAPPAVLAALGVRFDPLAGQFQPPGEATIRRVLEAVDGGEVDSAVTSWLASSPGRPRRHVVAVDGKARAIMQLDAQHGERHQAGTGDDLYAEGFGGLRGEREAGDSEDEEQQGQGFGGAGGQFGETTTGRNDRSAEAPPGDFARVWIIGFGPSGPRQRSGTHMPCTSQYRRDGGHQL